MVRKRLRTVTSAVTITDVWFPSNRHLLSMIYDTQVIKLINMHLFDIARYFDANHA